MKRLLVLLCVFLPVVSFAADTLSFRVKQTGHWAFYGTENPVVDLMLCNERGVPDDYSLSCTINEYDGTPLFKLEQEGVVPAKDSSGVSFSFLAISPGFYSAEIADGGRVARCVNIAYEPERIAFSDFEGRGGKGDFVLLADEVALERRGFQPQFSIVRNKELSGKGKNVYDFRMISRGDVQIVGYMAFPRGKKNLPVMVSYVMKDEASANPLADFTSPPDMAELVLYLDSRGEGMEFFRNLLADIILSIDFVAQRKETDLSRIYTQGRGVASVCSFLSGTVDGRIAASFVQDPQLGRFTEFFSLESLASSVENPVLFGLALQEDTYALQEIFCLYNRIGGAKEYFMFPDRSAVERKQWIYIRDAFMKRVEQ